MKKLMFAIGLGLISGSVYASCFGPFCWTDSDTTINGRSVNDKGTGLAVATGGTIYEQTVPVGTVVVCSSCSNVAGGYAVCVATANVRASFIVFNTTANVVSCK